MTAGTDPGLARLVDAVLLPGFAGTELPGWLAERLAGGLAGVCWFAHNVESPAQARALADEVHGARPGALVAADEEGGDVTRLEAAEGSSWPGNAALGRLDDVSVTRAVSAALGRQARRAGIDLVLAPVADVGSDPDNPVIGVRAFGADPGLVARHTAAAVAGLHSAGALACLKHYPGHGDTSTDSHLAQPVVDVDLETLRRRDLPPFAAGLAAGARAVLTAHVVFPALDGAPATLSGPVLGLLRNELGFDGVVVSDALDMHAISRGVGRGRGAVLALAAGIDVLCLGNPRFPETYDDRAVLNEVRDAVVAAVRDGDLPVARLEEARDRAGALVPPAPTAYDPGEAADGRLGLDVARRVVETHGNVRVAGAVAVVDLRRVNVAAGRTRPRLVQAVEHAGVPVRLADGRAVPDDGGAVVALVDAPYRDPEQRERLAHLLRARPDAVVVHAGLPDERDDLGERWLRTWGGGRVNARAAAEHLVGSAP